ncbi:Ig-like domain-containing protein [Leucobacter komagatae]|uniref:Ig-like domain-containing protein n=1 Tax=Leucobacter komagatae TaxID=55969 RepID=UPI0018DB916E|nr:Ig-like domain-containing protein [Leucobacter komagatae]
MSVAGNGLEELPLQSGELYCPNLPGSIVTTPADLTYPDATDVWASFEPFVAERSGSKVTYSVRTEPTTGTLDVLPNGFFIYQWGAASTVSFEVTVRNAAGQESALPVTLKRLMPSPVVLTSSATEVTQGDSVSIAARIEASDTALLPTGTVTFTGEGDGQSWAEDLGPDGVASVDIDDLPAGVHTFRASYSGDSNYAASVSEAVTVTVAAKEEPGTGEPECAEGEALNEAGECVTTGTEGEGGEGENPGGEGGKPDGGVKPEPLPDTDKTDAVLESEEPVNTVPAPIANTGAESSVWLAGASALIIGAGVSLVARRRRA